MAWGPCSPMVPAIASVSNVSATSSPLVSSMRKMPAGAALPPRTRGALGSAIAHAPCSAGPSNQRPWQLRTLLADDSLGLEDAIAVVVEEQAREVGFLRNGQPAPAVERHRDVAVGPSRRRHPFDREIRRRPEAHVVDRAFDQALQLVLRKPLGLPGSWGTASRAAKATRKNARRVFISTPWVSGRCHVYVAQAFRPARVYSSLRLRQ